MFNRRKFLAGIATSALVPAHAQLIGVPTGPLKTPDTPVDVVKIMSFSCSFCLSAESQDPIIETVAKRTKGRFVRAPIPVGGEDDGWRERTYYAARDMDSQLGETVKQSIYRGVQETGVPLNNLTQLYYWFLQDIPKMERHFDKLFELTKGPESQNALNRAIQLVRSSGAQLLPTYVLLVSGRIQATLDSSTSQNTSLSSLREDTIARIEALTIPKI
jgi:hypothetical protein